LYFQFFIDEFTGEMKDMRQGLKEFF